MWTAAALQSRAVRSRQPHCSPLDHILFLKATGLFARSGAASPMTDSLAIALAQPNPTLGDIDGNLDKVRRLRAEAKRLGADLVIFSELNVCGYPPEDLVLKPAFQA